MYVCMHTLYMYNMSLWYMYKCIMYIIHVCAIEDDGVSIWWLRDSQFKEPKVHIYCDLSAPQTQDSLNDPQWTGMYVCNG